MLISNTIFRLPTRKRTSYIITRQSDRQDKRVTKILLWCRMWNRPPPYHHKTKHSYSTKEKSKPLKRLNTARLADDKVEKLLTNTVENCLKSTPLAKSNIDKGWECLKEYIYSIALSILRPMERKHQDWFDNSTEIRKLLDEKHKLHKLYLKKPNSQSIKDAFTNIRNNVQKQLCQMQDIWLIKKVGKKYRNSQTSLT
ncbi:cytochrome P450 2D20 [Biomphalaria glabrata]